MCNGFIKYLVSVAVLVRTEMQKKVKMKELERERDLYKTTNLFPACLSVFVLPSSCQPGGSAADRGEAEGEAGPLEVHQALENPLLHPGWEPAALPERQICRWPLATRPRAFSVFHPVSATRQPNSASITGNLFMRRVPESQLSIFCSPV